MSDLPLIDVARAAAILQSRWENDPLRRFAESAATPKQSTAWASPKSEVAVLGANRSGKSDWLAGLVASLARFGNPNPRDSYSSGGRLVLTDRAMGVWVVGLTEKLIKEGIQPKLFRTAHSAVETHPPFIPEVEVAGVNVNDQTWRLKNGGMVAFKSADAGADVFQSAARDLIAFDEICAEAVYNEAVLRVGGAQRRLLIRIAATLLPPPGIVGGVSWYMQRKVKPWRVAGNVENQTGNPHPYLDVFTMSLRENPAISLDEIQRLEEVFPPGSIEHNIRIMGLLVETIAGTRAYTAHNRRIHLNPQLTPDAIDPRYPLALCVDFNVEPCVWEIGQYIDRTWLFYDEIKLDACNVPMMCEAFRQKYPTHRAPIHIYGDQTGTIRNVQTGHSNYYLMQEALASYPAPVLMKVPENRNPYVMDRVNAVNRMLSGPDGRVGLQYGPLCVELAADFDEVEKDPRGGIKKTHHKESLYYQRTHASDAVGYAVAHTDPVEPYMETARSLRHIPTPGYLGRGGRAGYSTGAPDEYQRRLRRGPSGGILPPRRV